MRRHEGLSLTAFAKTTSLAQPKPCASAVRSAVARMVSPMSLTALMLMPAREDPISTEEQTTSVSASARGMERISFFVGRGHALVDEGAEATDEVHADCLGCRVEGASKLYVVLIVGGACHQCDGVTAMRLLTIGMPSQLRYLRRR